MPSTRTPRIFTLLNLPGRDRWPHATAEAVDVVAEDLLFDGGAGVADVQLDQETIELRFR